MVYAHFGVPCGTASRAREIYIEDGPKPLRSSLESDGISTLDGLDLRPYLFGLFLGDPSYYVYTPKHFGSRVDILIGL